MSKSFISALRNLTPLGLGIFLIYYSLSTITADQRTLIWSYIEQAHPIPILISIVFGVLSHLSRAYRWKFLLNPMGYYPSFINLTGAVLVNYLFHLGIPRSGDVLRVTVISAYEKIPFSKGLGTVISERVIDLVMMILLVFSAIYVGGDWVQEQLGGSTILLVSFGVFIGFVAAIIAFPFLINTKRFPYFSRIKDFFLNIFQGIISIRSIPNALAFWAHTVFIWLMYVLMFWAIQFSLPEAALLSPKVVLIGFCRWRAFYRCYQWWYWIVSNSRCCSPLIIMACPMKWLWPMDGLLWSTQTLLILLFGGLSFVSLPVINRKK